MTVKFCGHVKKMTGGDDSYTPKKSSSVRELIEELGMVYGDKFKSFLITDNSCLILVNGKGLMLSGGLDTRLGPNDKTEILPVVIAG